MRHLTKPTDDPKSVFLNCISSVTDVDLKNRLTNCANIVVNEANDFEKKIKLNELHTITKNKSTKANKNSHVLNGQVTINEMKDVYTSYFVPKDSPGRLLYDRILSQPKNNKCPFCFQRQVSTVDHYLPKAYYPWLSVVPINLVASCKDCNFIKLGQKPGHSYQEILHPYYDNVENELWLKAEVVGTSPVSLRFFVECPKSWDKILKERVEYHFSSLELNVLYSAEAASELNNINYQLNDQFRTGGENAVKEHLKDAAKTRSMAHINSWQTAMYTAISTDRWFCNAGFNF